MQLTNSLKYVILVIRKGANTMATISLRVNDDELRLIQAYITANNLNMSAFIREAALDKIEDDFNLDKERLIRARDAAHTGKKYTFDEAWAEVGV